MSENVFPVICKLRENKCSTNCPVTGCSSTYDSVEMFQKMTKRERSRFISLIRDITLPDSILLKQLHQALLDLMTLKCPTCSIPVDPFPDACSAIMCSYCGNHYCNFCFEAFATSQTDRDRANAHTHAATHNKSKAPASRDAFLSNSEETNLL